VTANDPSELVLVTVMAEKGTLAHIEYGGQESSVVGWMDSRMLEKQGTSLLGILGALGGSPASTGTVTLQCAASTPVLAEVDGKTYRLGEVRAGGTVLARKRAGGGHTLVLESFDFFSGGLGQSTPAKASVEVFLPADADRCTEKHPG
jgi:hypothetical protein